MTSRFDVLTQQLFQKDIADCTVEELEELAHAHPYFAPAQYALLLKLKGTDYISYEKQFQKAILYYHDPLAFDQFINENQYLVDDTYFSPNEIVSPAIENDSEETSKDVYNPPESQEDFLDNIEIQEETKGVEADPLETVIENKEEFVLEIPPQGSFEPVAEESLASEPKAMEEEALPAPVAATEIVKPETKKEPEPVDNGLAFEPYHTVDYFASQGIKLSQEEATKDKFGKQLKSFTEWLKTMKKLPAPEQGKPLDTVAEQKVESLAAHSVEGGEVYTETMAEVWTRQGNKEKAIEIYNKLSLLNPSKKAYFAAKINSLS